jgi:hypothetical protein
LNAEEAVLRERELYNALKGWGIPETVVIVPGHSGVPEGEKAPGKKKGFIPGLSPVILVGLIGLLGVLVRRRLL